MSSQNVKATITALCPYCHAINQINPPGEVCFHFREYRTQLMEAVFVELENYKVKG